MKGKVICDDISNIDNDYLRGFGNGTKIDLVIGGPPCPAFSKSRFYRTDKPKGKDDISLTIENYFRVIKNLKPVACSFLKT